MKQITCLLLLLLPFTLKGQHAYDPLADSSARLLTAVPGLSDSTSAYIWYPGQLAAWRQQQCLRESHARCVNVGYPGHFFAPSSHAEFRRSIRLHHSASLHWYGPGRIALQIDGRSLPDTLRSLSLPAGKHELCFEVESTTSLPCLRVEGAGADTPAQWQARMEGAEWTLAEGGQTLRERLPDDPCEWTVALPPYAMQPVAHTRITSAGSARMEADGCLLIDFFHLEVGEVTLQAAGNGTLYASVGETPEEALQQEVHHMEQYPLPPLSVKGKTGTLRLPRRALRYLCLRSTGDISLSDVTFQAAVWPVRPLMTFRCDDSHINRLFDMSVATLHSSMHGFYLDGLKRDFLPWAMDAVLSTLAGDWLFDDRTLTRSSLSIALMPLHPASDDLGIPDYPLHAPVALMQDYLRRGNLDTWRMYRPRIVQTMQFYADLLARGDGWLHGNCGSPDFGFTPGWSVPAGPDRNGVAAYAQMMLYLDYRICAFMARTDGDTTLADRYQAAAHDLRQRILFHFWDSVAGAFINGCMADGSPDRRISHHTQYWAILSGLFPAEAMDKLFDEVLPSLPLYYEDVSYERGYEMLAYALSGRTDRLWDFLNRTFGHWTEQGYSRFPEHLRPLASKSESLSFYGRPYGLSLCHGANGVPVVVGVLYGLLGFRPSPLRPHHYEFHPQLLHLQEAEAEVPVAEGIIRLHLRADGRHHVEAPQGCEVEIVMPQE